MYIQNGPYRSGLVDDISKNFGLKGMSECSNRLSTSAVVTLKYCLSMLKYGIIGDSYFRQQSAFSK